MAENLRQREVRISLRGTACVRSLGLVFFVLLSRVHLVLLVVFVPLGDLRIHLIHQLVVVVFVVLIDALV